MSVLETKNISSRPPGFKLGLALLVSLLVHGFFGGGWWVGEKAGWWKPRPLAKATLAKPAQKKTPAEPQPEREPQPENYRPLPLAFITVDPALVVPDPEDEGKGNENGEEIYFQAAGNTRNSNRQIKELNGLPNLDGTDHDSLKLTEDALPQKTEPETGTILHPVEKPKPFPDKGVDSTAQAASKLEREKQMEAADYILNKLKTRMEPGEDKHNRPEKEAKEDSSPRLARPRNLAEAAARSGRPGKKGALRGGVTQMGPDSLGARGTLEGAYYDRMFDAVSDRWGHLFDDVLKNSGMAGRVVLEFKLYSDGRIADVVVKETTVSEIQTLLCQKGLLDNAPYAKWTEGMRREIGTNSILFSLTFDYEY